MARERKTLTREEASEFTRALERKAEAIGIPLDQWVLKPGKPNDIRQGTGPRFAIVQRAQECAAAGGKYGHVLGAIVIQGNGDRYQIRTHDLAGFVCANGYCEVVPPGEARSSGKEAVTDLTPHPEGPEPDVMGRPIPAEDSALRSRPGDTKKPSARTNVAEPGNLGTPTKVSKPKRAKDPTDDPNYRSIYASSMTDEEILAYVSDKKKMSMLTEAERYDFTAEQERIHRQAEERRRKQMQSNSSHQSDVPQAIRRHEKIKHPNLPNQTRSSVGPLDKLGTNRLFGRLLIGGICVVATMIFLRSLSSPKVVDSPGAPAGPQGGQVPLAGPSQPVSPQTPPPPKKQTKEEKWANRVISLARRDNNIYEEGPHLVVEMKTYVESRDRLNRFVHAIADADCTLTGRARNIYFYNPSNKKIAQADPLNGIRLFD